METSAASYILSASLTPGEARLHVCRRGGREEEKERERVRDREREFGGYVWKCV
jgi:hypothetical protein